MAARHGFLNLRLDCIDLRRGRRAINTKYRQAVLDTCTAAGAQPWDNYLFVTAAVIIVWLNRRKMFQLEDGVTDVLSDEQPISQPRLA